MQMSLDSTRPASEFAGLTILVVEDETIVSLLIEDMLFALGCATVALAGNIATANAYLDNNTPDAALLDVNLNGTYVFPVAERLVERNIGFAFVTGYGRGGIPAEWRPRPVLQKPFTQPQLTKALEWALARKGGAAD